MRDIFIETNSKMETMDEVKRLLDLSNEEMARKFNITSSNKDIATLVNAIILDPIIEYEIQNNNFNGYSHCWNDSNVIYIATKMKEDAYQIYLKNINERDSLCKDMEIIFPNGESVIFRQNYKEKENDSKYTIADVSTEIVSVKGNSELLQKVIAQIERFSERELIQQDDKNFTELEENSEDIDIKIPEEILDKQIAAKKLQIILEGSNDNIEAQTIDFKEFEILTNEILTSEGLITQDYIGTSSSAVKDWSEDLKATIPVEQYMHIRMPNNKVISIEFFARENSGRIVLKKYDDLISNRDDVKDIFLRGSISENELLDVIKYYIPDLSLDELLRKKLKMKDSKLSELEMESMEYGKEEVLIDKQIQENSQDIGE